MLINKVFSLQFIINFIPVMNILFYGYLIYDFKYFMSELKSEIMEVEDLYYMEVENK